MARGAPPRTPEAAARGALRRVDSNSGRSPLRSPAALKGSLTPNDDAGERARARARSRLAAGRRRGEAAAPVAAGAGVPAERAAGKAAGGSATLTASQLVNVYGNCIKAAKMNKITKENTWSYELIDELPNLVVPRKLEEGSGSYHPVSNILDAARQLYEKRVDWLQTESFRVLGGLGRAQQRPEGEDEETAEGSEGSEGVEAGKTASRRRRAQKEADPRATLAANPADLNLKDHERPKGNLRDPMLHHVSQLFDSTSADSMLLHNLPMFGPEVVFDSDFRPSRDASTRAEAGDNVLEDVQVPLGALEAAWERAAADLRGARRLCPSLDKLRFMCGDAPVPRREEESRQLVRRWLGEEQGDQVQSQVDFEGPEPSLFSDAPGAAPEPSDDFAGIDVMEDIGFDDDEGGGYDGAAMEAGESLGGAPGLSETEAGIDLEWLKAVGEGGRAAEAFGLRYARSNFKAAGGHWHRAQGAAAEGGDAEAAPEKKPAKQTTYIDFENLPAVDPAAFTRAKKNKEISKAEAGHKAAAHCLLPEDLHYRAARLARLFLKPRFGVTSGAGPAGPRPDDGGDIYDGGFDDGGFDEDGDMYGEAAWGALPPGAAEGDEPQPLQFRLRKNVNIKLLKGTLSDGLASFGAGSKGAGKKRGGGDISFRELLERFPAESEAGPARDISVHMCFWGLLSLANERGLTIQGRESMNELVIQGAS